MKHGFGNWYPGRSCFDWGFTLRVFFFFFKNFELFPLPNMIFRTVNKNIIIVTLMIIVPPQKCNYSYVHLLLSFQGFGGA